MHRFERPLVSIAALVLLISLILPVVPFTRGGFPSGHDATAHLTYTFLFDRALERGQFPVRWVEWVRSGESQPLFNFYPPGLYYLTEAVHSTGARLSASFKGTVVLVWWSAALFTFLWLRPLGWMAATLAAALFMWAPYVLVDVYVRAAYPELMAMAFAPGVLWAVDRLVRRDRGIDALLVACFVAAMLMSHLLSSLIFAPVIGVYALYRTLSAPSPARAIARLAAGAAIGAGIATFYLLPSMVELDHVAIGRMTSGYSAYQQHFVAPAQWFSRTWGYGASVPGGGDEMPLQIGRVQWLVLAAAVARLALGIVTRRPLPHGGAIAFWLTAVGLAMFLMTDASAPLWRAIPALAYLQFPWRYFMVVSLGTAALAGLLLASVPSRTWQAALVIVLLVWQHQMHRAHLKPLHYFPLEAININSPHWPELEHMGAGAFLERGFTPVAARRDTPSGIGRWTVLSGDGSVREQRSADHVLELEATAATEMRLRINTHHFPGWVVFVDGLPAGLSVDEYGFMQVSVPPGTHQIEARFTNTPVRALANTITLISLGIWAAGFVALGRRRGLSSR